VSISHSVKAPLLLPSAEEGQEEQEEQKEENLAKNPFQSQEDVQAIVEGWRNVYQTRVTRKETRGS